MKLRRPLPRQQPETIVALIDVVFFLLVFFMLIGRMDATAPFTVTPPTGETGSDMPAGGLTLAVAPGGDLALDGQPIDRAALADRLGGPLGESAPPLVRINADRKAELRHVLPLVAEIEAMGAREVVLVVTPNPP